MKQKLTLRKNNNKQMKQNNSKQSKTSVARFWKLIYDRNVKKHKKAGIPGPAKSSSCRWLNPTTIEDFDVSDFFERKWKIANFKNNEKARIPGPAKGRSRRRPNHTCRYDFWFFQNANIKKHEKAWFFRPIKSPFPEATRFLLPLRILIFPIFLVFFPSFFFIFLVNLALSSNRVLPQQSSHTAEDFEIPSTAGENFSRKSV